MTNCISTYSNETFHQVRNRLYCGDWISTERKVRDLEYIKHYKMHTNQVLIARIIRVDRYRVMDRFLRLKWRYRFYIDEENIIINHNDDLKYFKCGNPVHYENINININ